MSTNKNTGLAFDFSSLSRGRLRTFNLLAYEIERREMEYADCIALSDSDLEMLSAAGTPGLRTPRT